MIAKDRSKVIRLAALRRFATTITILNIVGHIFLGFEQSWAQPLVALATTYSLEMVLEAIDARSNQRPLAFAGGLRNLVDFLLPAHITGLSIAMLLWANDQLLPFAFAAAVATGSKALLRVPIGKSRFEAGMKVIAANHNRKNAMRFQRYSDAATAIKASTATTAAQSSRVPRASRICA